MNIFIQLADYAQKGPNDKINSIGLGWTRTSTPLAAHSLVIFVEADDQPPRTKCELLVKLVNEKGETFTDSSGRDLGVKAQLESGDPKHKAPVSTITPIVLTLAAGMPLEPGVHRWEVTCDRFPDRTWSRSFEVFRKEDSGSDGDEEIETSSAS